MNICSVGDQLFQGNRQVDRQTGRHNEANSRFSQFYERAKKKVNELSKRDYQ
jgi:Zn-finger nucleic acid-binding protein